MKLINRIMGLYLEQLEFGKVKAGTRKWAKNQRNRYLRRTKIDKEPLTKLRKGYEY